MARSILRGNKILVLDEATANVDLETDHLIQRKLRSAFENSTVLIVAHRLATVIDADRILVMSEGRAAEYDHPFRLLTIDPDSEVAQDDGRITNRDGIFAKMILANDL